MKNSIAPILGLVFLLLFACEVPDSKENEDTARVEEKPAPGNEIVQDNKKTIVFFGNSLSAAYGIDPSQGFVDLIAKRIDSLSLSYKVINAGLSGETTAGGKTRIDWILRQPVDVFILELGGNDALRGIAPEDSYNNLKYIIEQVKEKYPQAKIVIAGMEAPPNMGVEFTGEFRRMYPKLAKEFNASLIPFLLDGVGGVPKLNLPDGIHPTPEGHQIVAENIWNVLKGIL